MTILDDKRAILKDLQNNKKPIPDEVSEKLKNHIKGYARIKMRLKMVRKDRETVRFTEDKFHLGELESAFLEFQNGEERILLTAKDGDKAIYNSKYIELMAFEKDDCIGTTQ